MIKTLLVSCPTFGVHIISIEFDQYEDGDIIIVDPE